MLDIRRLSLVLLAAAALTSCSGGSEVADPPGAGSAPLATTPDTPTPAPAMTDAVPPAPAKPTVTKEIATFGAGCYWCVEAVLEQLPGVIDVTSGFMGGTVPNPSYRQVCTGDTGHAEVVQVTFDPSKVSYPKLLDWFFKLHDPTTLNRQGGDEGTQYRSVIFFHSEAQRAAAVAKKAELEAAKAFPSPIVTEITAASTYYEADVSHQDYYRLNKNKNPYCRVVITPKLDKLGLEK